MTIQEEITAWKKTAPKSVRVIAATNEFLTFRYERIPSVKAKVTLNFPSDYPASAIITSIEGLPPGLSKKLVREMENVAKSKCSDTAATPHIQPVAQHIVNALETNRFVPCWKEVRKLVEMSKQSQQQQQQKNDAITVVNLHDTKGVIRLKFTHGEYFYDCKLTVNPGYPSTTTLDDPLQLSLVKSNFPKQIVQDIVMPQAKGFVRCLQDGVSQEQAWSQSNPIQLPTKSDSQNEQPSTTPAVVGTGDPTPSLLPLVSMLRSKLQQLPQTNCSMCRTPVLPSNPKQLATLYETSNKKPQQQRPIYSACGCWFHYKCMNKLMTEPPFGLSCPTCGQRAYHPDWSADPKELEHAHAERQARQREIDDVAMMF